MDEPRDQPPVLPGPVRDRLLALASARLGGLPAGEVPPALRAVARFTPAKRARLGAAPLMAALEGDPVFRQQVAAALPPGLRRTFDTDQPLPEAAPEDVAVVAYLRRPEGWRTWLERAAELVEERRRVAAGSATLDTVQRLTEQLEATRAAARAEADRLRCEVQAAREEAVALRRKVRELGDRAGRAEAGARAAQAALAAERAALEDAGAAAHAEVRRLRERVAEAEAALTGARQAAREGRHSDDLRLRLLLDTVLGAAAGLRRELALPPVHGRPADAVAGEYAPAAPAPPPVQGRAPDDPAVLDALLGQPLVHLLVDGYNVTKTGYGELALEAQRGRLLSGLGAVAARTGAEVTVVFDGVERVTPVAVASPRGVRLLFSRAGETADAVLVRLVRLEPQGRPVVVVSSDNEVIEGARRGGARTAPSVALLRLLAR
jgi:hypothetical protein